MSNSTDLSPNPTHIEVLRSASCRLARDSMVQESSQTMARTAEAEAGHLGTLPGTPPGADSLLGVAPSVDLLTTQGIGAQSGSPSVKDGHLDGMTETISTAARLQ